MFKSRNVEIVINVNQRLLEAWLRMILETSRGKFVDAREETLEREIFELRGKGTSAEIVINVDQRDSRRRGLFESWCNFINYERKLGCQRSINRRDALKTIRLTQRIRDHRRNFVNF